ncbi:MAG: hypothetical protein K2X32_07465 [Phycisphaerales bacterium]|nr:hypothetical protein [Phycisphaerales bacterium]
MRLLTLKLHRAFPELDRFEEANAAAFVAEAGRASTAWRVVSAAASITAFVVLAPIALLALGGVAAALQWSPLIATPHGEFHLWVIGVSIVASFVLSVSGALVVRDMMLRHQISKLLGDQARCRMCRYELLGLRRDKFGMVHCPECGTLSEVDSSFGQLVGDGKALQRLGEKVAQVRAVHAAASASPPTEAVPSDVAERSPRGAGGSSEPRVE